MFLSLTSLECAAVPVLGNSALPPLQQHLIALCPCWILHFRVDSCVIKSSCTLVGSQRQPEKPLGYAGVLLLPLCVRQRRKGPAPCPWCVPSHSPRASLTVSHCSCEKWLSACSLSGPFNLDSCYLLGRCKYLDLFQNRSVLLLFRKLLFLSSLGFFFFCVIFDKIKDFSKQEAYISTTV